MLQPILDGEADFVIGSRFVDGGGSEDMPAYRRLGIKVITAASNLSSDLGIQDTQSGFRAFSKLAIERLRFDSEGMELSLEMLEDAHEKELKIKEVPTLIRYDVPKGSSFTALSHGFTVLAWAMLHYLRKNLYWSLDCLVSAYLPQEQQWGLTLSMESLIPSTI